MDEAGQHAMAYGVLVCSVSPAASAYERRSSSNSLSRSVSEASGGTAIATSISHAA